MLTPTDSNGNNPLDAVVADYLQQVVAGTPPDRDALVAAHPDLADRLRAFFADLDRMGSQGESFRLPNVSLPEDFGDYEFLGEIGRGGMGVVYRVRQQSLGRIVALKMILSGPFADGAALRRFREEAATISRLDHPNIVPVYEVGEHRGLPYFTMKLIEGQSLTRCLDRYASDPKGAAELLVKVCDAVHHAHQRGVLHRDLKPGNILIDSAGEPFVTDFGLSRRVEEARTLTHSSGILGTPEYMAPEQAAGVKDLTTGADVYGLGAILFALCTGEPPFRAPTVYETIRRVVEDLPAPPRKLRVGVPRDLETICLKCLAKEPAKRYASAESVAADLARWRKGEPIAARPAGPVERLTKWARRRPTAAALVAVSVVSLAALLGGGIYSADRITRQNDALRNQAGDLSSALDAVRNNEQVLTAKQTELEANARQLTRTVATLRRNEYSLELEQYRGKLVEAQRELAAGNKQNASQILDACQWDLRNWEFDHLAKCCSNGPPVVLVGDEVEAPQPDPKTRERPKETRSVAFTPDGKHLVTTIRGRLTVFDAVTGKVVRTIDEKRLWDAFTLSPDGKLLACYDASAAGVFLMEFETGKPRGGVGTGTVRGSGIGSPMDTFAKKALAFSPDSKRLLVGSTVFDVATGSGVVLKYQLTGATSRSDGWHEVVPFSPDGKLVAMSFNPVNLGEKNQAAVWDSQSSEVRAWLKGDPQSFGFLAFSPAGDRIAIGGFRNAVEVFDPHTGERLFACEAPSQIKCVTFTHDGRRIITGDGTGTVRIYDAYLGKEILVLLPALKDRGLQALAASPDGSKIAAVVETSQGGQQVVIYRGTDSPRPGAIRGQSGREHLLRFGAHGNRIVALPRDQDRDSALLAGFDANTGASLFQHTQTWGGLVHPTEELVVLANRKNIDTKTGATVAEWAADAGPHGTRGGGAFHPRHVRIMPDGKQLFHLSHNDSSFTMYELATGQGTVSYRPIGVDPWNAVLAIHPDGSRIFVATNNTEQPSYVIRALKLLPPVSRHDTEPGGAERKLPMGRAEESTRFVGHTATVRCMAVSPNGRLLASGSDGDDRTVRIWDAETGKQLQVLRCPSAKSARGLRSPRNVDGFELISTMVRLNRETPPPSGGACLIGFSPDSRYLLVVPRSIAAAELWRVGRWDQPTVLEFLSDGGEPSDFAFSADSNRVRIIAGYNPRCFMWDVPTGKPTRPRRDVSFLKPTRSENPQ